MQRVIEKLPIFYDLYPRLTELKESSKHWEHFISRGLDVDFLPDGEPQFHSALDELICDEQRVFSGYIARFINEKTKSRLKSATARFMSYHVKPGERGHRPEWHVDDAWVVGSDIGATFASGTLDTEGSLESVSDYLNRIIGGSLPPSVTLTESQAGVITRTNGAPHISTENMTDHVIHRVFAGIVPSDWH